MYSLMSHGCQTPPFTIQQNEEEKGQEDKGGDEAKYIITLLAYSDITFSLNI
jgi:hypothetical protein